VIADGDVPAADALPAGLLGAGPDDDGPLVIAADGGLHKAQALGLRPALVVGDGDSLAPGVLDELANQGVDVQLHPRAKNQSDTELAIREAVRRGAQDVVVLGALGGLRFDHSLANVLLLSSSDIDAAITLVDGETSVRVVGRHGPERLEIEGAPGDFVSLLPLSDEVTGVTTTGLAFPLEGATLPQGPTLGLSNELVSARGSVSVESGRLAVIHTRNGGHP
jgi:thiamine pyrophosphokinase